MCLWPECVSCSDGTSTPRSCMRVVRLYRGYVYATVGAVSCGVGRDAYLDDLSRVLYRTPGWLRSVHSTQCRLCDDLLTVTLKCAPRPLNRIGIGHSIAVCTICSRANSQHMSQHHVLDYQTATEREIIPLRHGTRASRNRNHAAMYGRGPLRLVRRAF